MGRSSARWVLIPLTAMTMLLTGCLPDPAPTQGETPPPDEKPRQVEAVLSPDDLRERALATVERGILYRPTAESEGLVAHELGPLIIQEWIDDSSEAPPIDEVFWLEETVEIDGRSHVRWSFHWEMPDDARRGFRMTLDSTGSPAIWEVGDVGGGRPAVYVSTQLEAAAVELYGAPPEGGFSVERPNEEGWTVLRAIEAGPMALGPFVTVGAAQGLVHSLICRCMPTQVLDIPATADYRLVEATEAWVFAGSEESPAVGLRLEGLSF